MNSITDTYFCTGRLHISSTGLCVKYQGRMEPVSSVYIAESRQRFDDKLDKHGSIPGYLSILADKMHFASVITPVK